MASATNMANAPNTPHPEEHRIAVRLEGWAKEEVCSPPFEKQRCAQLLRGKVWCRAEDNGSPS